MTSPSPQLGQSRQRFLARVRTALGKTQAGQKPDDVPAVEQKLVRLASFDDALPELFTKRAREVGMTVHRLGGDTVAEKLVSLLNELNAKRVAMAAGDVDRQCSLSEALANSEIELVDWRTGDDAANFHNQYDLDAGITDVHAALAETGTLVLSSDARHSRGLSLVPPIHIAIVRRSGILPDMIDYWAQMRGLSARELPSSQVFITGPSKTADIEGELITGVHGPGQVHILLVDDA